MAGVSAAQSEDRRCHLAAAGVNARENGIEIVQLEREISPNSVVDATELE